MPDGGAPNLSLEGLLCHPQGFQLTSATPLQRAFCRMETGEPLAELADNPAVIESVGGPQAIAMLPTVAPLVSVTMAAVRTGKSQKAAAKAFRASQTCDLSMLKDGEIARYSVLSIDKDKAGAVYEHLCGKIEASPILSSLLVKPPAGESLFLHHPTGRIVEIKVMAGKRAGGSLVARWSIGATFDEAPRMNGADMKVNLPDALGALKMRLLPGAQVDIVGSPWAPVGPVYDMYVDFFGRPSAEVLFMIGKGPDMHPGHFTPELCARMAKPKSEGGDPQAYRTDVLALFADPEEALLSSLDVEACTRTGSEAGDLEPNGQPVTAAIDPANRRNAWTLTLVRPRTDGTAEVVLTRQWLGSRSAPLKSSEVFAEIAPILRLYQVEDMRLWSDQGSFDDKWELAGQCGINLSCDAFTETEWKGHALRLEKLVSEHAISLPNNAAMRADILGIRRKLTARSYQIILPSTSDGRHGDYAPSLVLALKHLASPVDIVQGVDQYDPLELRMLEQLRSRQADPMRYAAADLMGAFR